MNNNQINNLFDAPQLIDTIAESITTGKGHGGRKYLFINKEGTLSTTSLKKQAISFERMTEIVETLLDNNKIGLDTRDQLINSFNIITDYEAKKLTSLRKKLFSKNKISEVKHAQTVIARAKGKFRQIRETNPFFASIRIKKAGQKLIKAVKSGSRIAKGVNSGAFHIGESYFPEVFDKRNRYAGGDLYDILYMVWLEIGPRAGDFNEWCAGLEKGEKVPGHRDPRLHDFVGPHPKTKIPTVHYLTEKERNNYLLKVDKEGLICDHLYQHLTTRDPNLPYIFVIGLDGKIYIGAKKRGVKEGELAFNHSSFFSGSAVKGAGSLIIKNGKISILSNASGHYSSEQSEANRLKMMVNVLRAFEENGFDLTSFTVIFNGKEVNASTLLNNPVELE